jgi:hypothetical protein
MSLTENGFLTSLVIFIICQVKSECGIIRHIHSGYHEEFEFVITDGLYAKKKTLFSPCISKLIII